MQRTLILSAVLLLCCSSISASDNRAGDRWRVSILAAEISTASSTAWADDPHAGISLGLAYAPTPQWDVELTAASQSHVSPYNRLWYAPSPGGAPGTVYSTFEYRRYRVMPVDLSATRHFLVDQPIAPYVRAGVRYVDAPRDPVSSAVFVPAYDDPNNIPFVAIGEGFGLRARTSVQAGAGVRVRLTPRTAMRAEATRLLRSDGADFDPLTRYAIGVSWVF
jgi:hypothetical protein